MWILETSKMKNWVEQFTRITLQKRDNELRAMTQVGRMSRTTWDSEFMHECILSWGGEIFENRKIVFCNICMFQAFNEILDE